MFKRIALFLATNILVMVTISIVLSLTGAYHYMSPYGIDLPSLAVFSIIVGFVGAFVSLLMSKWLAKWVYRIHVINPSNPGDATCQWVLDTVYEMARSAGLSKMPEVGIYQAQELNAFATGATRNSSLVAVSTGLINSMDRNAVRAVIGHEITHIVNGDMVTMALLQGVVNTFVVFFARIAAWAVCTVVDSRARPIIRFVAIILFQIAFSILGSFVVCAFSRWREFRADAGGAKLAGRENMIHALQELKLNQGIKLKPADAFATMQIDGVRSWMNLLRTHPDLDLRIARLNELP